ncbi:MAG TPA: 30S ribosomal protein S20 [Candidatus Omnitrophota bacterium]|nr:30S ribosomal protein S20 [Candidatus Omnitrophota bacterium]
MANIKSNIKNLRKSKKNRKRNLFYKERIKRLAKVYKDSLAKGKEEAKKKLVELYSAIDKAALKKIIHKNKAARQKSRLTALLNKIK